VIDRILPPEGALKQLTSAELVEDALALAVARGVVMYPTPQKKREASVVPLTLLPSPVADDCFHLAKMLTWLGGRSVRNPTRVKRNQLEDF